MWQGCREGESSCTVGGNASWCSHSGKQCGVPQKVKKRATISLVGIYSNTNVVKCWDTCTPKFIATIFTIAKLWKEPRCPSTDEWIKKMWSIYTMDYYSAIKKNKILPFVMTWMELQGIMLSEVSQSEKDNYHMISLICGI